MKERIIKKGDIGRQKRQKEMVTKRDREAKRVAKE